MQGYTSIIIFEELPTDYTDYTDKSALLIRVICVICGDSFILTDPGLSIPGPGQRSFPDRTKFIAFEPLWPFVTISQPITYIEE